MAAPSLVRRWAHSATLLDGGADSAVFVFGGYGVDGVGTVKRLDDVIVLRIDETGSITETRTTRQDAQPWPTARQGHAAATASREGAAGVVAVIFGGRGSPSQPFNDAWTLRLGAENDLEWTELETAGTLPPPRWAHTLTSVGGGCCVVVGGRDATQTFRGVHALELEGETRARWSCVAAAGAPQVFAHAAVSVDGGLVVFGGVGSTKTYRLDAAQIEWSSCPATAAERRYAHCAATSDDGEVIIFGGVTERAAADEPVIVIHAADAAQPPADGADAALPRVGAAGLGERPEGGDEYGSAALFRLGAPPAGRAPGFALPWPVLVCESTVSGMFAASASPGDVPFPVHAACVALPRGRLLVVGGGAACHAFAPIFGSTFVLETAAIEAVDAPPQRHPAADDGAADTLRR
ncbi:hypothetical protein M885DRAFT_529566 [Pelagophyceae sp. CCMP2097]|nr:hypothetical protein M885DRAFT_529566 [Pelagophyceae sp. CCMP2097]|mmetsp:Transcript_31202/g.109790  ORF Transcript_31202/g.109790 Transcript_31202/m.109790 type:complete len:408 (+) Transcript_31202:27-1250(+)